MSDFSPSPRVRCEQIPPRVYFAHRRFLKFLLLDFKERCAYSGQHVQRVGGIGGMDIDHHNPKLKSPERNAYENLFLATRHCNGKKSDIWPDAKQRAAGLRFLNPCKEMDYGVHLFEDPVTFSIWGATPAGRYHVRWLDLNADHLVRERRRRDEMRKQKAERQVVTALRDDALTGVKAFSEDLDEMIPTWPQKPEPPRPP